MKNNSSPTFVSLNQFRQTRDKQMFLSEIEELETDYELRRLDAEKRADDVEQRLAELKRQMEDEER